MFAWIKQHRLAALAFAFVAIVWSLCLAASLWRAFTGPQPGSMETFGQFGDTFGTVNALFTGLALVGLVYTVSQQQKQLQQQEVDSQENRHALAREKREQFLTARLNATLAMLQARQAKMAFLSENNFLGIAEMQREIRKLSLRLSILVCEANLGFEIGDWSEEIERLAIRDHLRLYFQELLDRCHFGEIDMLRFHPQSMIQEKLETDLLCKQIRHRHPSTAELTQEFMNRLATLETTEEAAKHISDFLNGSVNHL
jgi:hypothetical protein